MNHVHLIEFYSFGARLHPLSEIKEGEDIFKTWGKLSIAKSWLDVFFDETEHISMSHAKEAARILYEHLQKILSRISIKDLEFPDKDKEPITSYEAIWLVDFLKSSSFVTPRATLTFFPLQT